MKKQSLVYGFVLLSLASCSGGDNHQEQHQQETEIRNINIRVDGAVLVFELMDCIGTDNYIDGWIPSGSHPDGQILVGEALNWGQINPTNMTSGNIYAPGPTWMNLGMWDFYDGQVDNAALEQGRIDVTIPGGGACTSARIDVIN